jgi:hypothetical protein
MAFAAFASGTHRPAEAAALPIVHDVFSQTIIVIGADRSSTLCLGKRIEERLRQMKDLVGDLVPLRLVR